MELTLARCSVRSFQEGDAPSLALHADNAAIACNLRDGFPHPYRIEHAHAFISRCRADLPEVNFAIVVDGAAVGSIGYVPGTNVERVSAELGYWLGEPHWGRGIATEAVRAVTAHAIEQLGLTRVFAVPFAHNPASCRVLEKAGFTLETRLHRSAIKDGRGVDQLLYAYVVPD
jgi:RimJ/RimL family protein N-acetyltransferase